VGSGGLHARDDRLQPRWTGHFEQAANGGADEQRKAREALEEAFEGALSDHVIEYGGKPVASVKKAIAAAARRAKVPCSPHVFRHTAGVWMAQADVPMQKIAQFLGHTSTRVTETVYARYSPRFMADAAGALDW
jgi:integrase